MKITDADFEKHCQTLNSFFKNAMQKYQWLVPHLNDTRSSAIDKTIEAQTSYDFTIKHFEKIVELTKQVGRDLGLEK